MGELVGLPEWLFAILFVTIGVAIVFGFAWRNTRRQIASTVARRPNPPRQEFMVLMASDVSEETSSFLWETALFYCQGRGLTPHPDDDLLKDLPIDDDDISLDWPRDFAKRKGFHESNLPDWPEGCPVTLRNYGRWLDMYLNLHSSART